MSSLPSNSTHVCSGSSSMLKPDLTHRLLLHIILDVMLWDQSFTCGLACIDGPKLHCFTIHRGSQYAPFPFHHKEACRSHAVQCTSVQLIQFIHHSLSEHDIHFAISIFLPWNKGDRLKGVFSLFSYGCVLNVFECSDFPAPQQKQKGPSNRCVA